MVCRWGVAAALNPAPAGCDGKGGIWTTASLRVLTQKAVAVGGGSGQLAWLLQEALLLLGVPAAVSCCAEAAASEAASRTLALSVICLLCR